ncbi:hypothetical protein M1M27_gp49 [Cellulophaga phage Ingeline_1]|uniref:Uncharacterized protein n=1 Tax=Cellulophaga phage Ingeline_1 TaxID=2745674 RepID=A0A8E5E965_9CAUD|nr:hypothetical protein M1M27_gp49 [Cellulophaga phage Ingeline_1]QQV90006.1 hypothetical protein Ingeline2_2 [Cellulophaga phage Ingeline_2]QQV90056.1 hypothetical protein Ingeline3_2 [Cellulophaga phage Ingeline_3]QQV90106.1 hypothetical protein Ingeline4_2 [Cellulophaga phage Ingeline_4]QQV90156.1 hypothetical protein Ingeline5_2 [Cellulophaga phage Ingeline_5]QQV90205.1 hypothetical protein Ingeline6_2 [Cellulophaga phage Ingeline_6]QQV90255.1 hypothetical protein Ingeline7_2 [Cellulophag
MAKKKKLQSELEGLHYSILQDWVDKGRSEQMPEEMILYLEQLNFANRLWDSCNTPRAIIKKLEITYPDLDLLSAKSRFEDAMQWFYLDDKTPREVYRNMLFEKQLKLVDAAILSARTVDDYNKASLILQRAYVMKGLDKDEEDVIPDHAFDKPTKIYSLDTSDFADLPQNTNRNRLGEYIDTMNLTEEQSLKIKQEAGIEPKELFGNYEQEEDDK